MILLSRYNNPPLSAPSFFSTLPLPLSLADDRIVALREVLIPKGADVTAVAQVSYVQCLFYDQIEPSCILQKSILYLLKK